MATNKRTYLSSGEAQNQRLVGSRQGISQSKVREVRWTRIMRCKIPFSKFRLQICRTICGGITAFLDSGSLVLWFWLSPKLFGNPKATKFKESMKRWRTNEGQDQLFNISNMVNLFLEKLPGSKVRLHCRSDGCHPQIIPTYRNRPFSSSIA
jgi:hypothetical protein